VKRKVFLRHEASTAAAIGGKTTPGSGNLRNPYLKEDANGKHVLVQCKITDAASYRLTQDEFQKCEDHALMQAKMPAFRVTLPTQDLAVIRWQDYIQLLKDAGMG
jgi:hypothetical protein